MVARVLAAMGSQSTPLASNGDAPVVSLRAENEFGDGSTADVKDTDPELEAEVAAAAVLFERLPAEWQRYLDDEAIHGRNSYTGT